LFPYVLANVIPVILVGVEPFDVISKPDPLTTVVPWPFSVRPFEPGIVTVVDQLQVPENNMVSPLDAELMAA
jgi:hypothetical protein